MLGLLAALLLGQAQILTSPPSTNLLRYSSQFQNAAWSSGSATVLDNQTTAPDGTLTGALFTSVGSAYWAQSISSVTGGIYSVSFYVEAGTLASASVSVYDNTLGDICTSSATTVNSSTWTRIGCTTTGSSNGGIFAVVSTTGSGTIYIADSQLEQLPYATSYIPTTGAAVTRLSSIPAGKREPSQAIAP